MSNLDTAKGVKDWYGEEAILRGKIKKDLSSLFEKYGFMPLETPMIELQETLFKKGGSEIHSEVFKLSDRGNRDLALRFDHTVPLARYVSMNQLNFPFKRYAIGEVFRDGPTQVEQGRYRIFTQCDVDIVGSNNISTEFEILGLVKDSFDVLGLKDIELNINHRVILDEALKKVGVKDEHKTKVMSSLDKLDKIGKQAVVDEIADTTNYIQPNNIKGLLDVLEPKENNNLTLNSLTHYLPKNKGLDDIKKLLDYSLKSDYEFVVFNPSLARGLDYYTGTIFEAYTKDKENFKSAIAGGGRFDDMIGDFSNSNEKIPAVGLSFGLERLVHIVSQKSEVKQNVADIYLVAMPGCIDYAMKTASTLRVSGLNTSIHYDELNKIGKALKHADREGIPYVGIIGEREVETKTVALKNLKTGIQKNVDIQMAYVNVARTKCS